MAIPPRLAMQVAGEEDIGVLTETIRKEMCKALEELSDYDPDEIDGEEPEMEEDLEEEEEDDE